MKNFGSNKPQTHDNKRIQLQPFENFPAEPVVGELVYIKNSSISGLFVYGPSKTWDKLQTIDSTVIAMGADFPANLIPATLFYNNMADVDELDDEEQAYGFYYVSENKTPVKILDVENHLNVDDPHKQYMQVSEAVSTFQPLKISQTVSAAMQTKLLPGEPTVINAFKNPMPIKAGFYKVECVVWTDNEGSFVISPNFGHPTPDGLCIQVDKMISYTTYLNIKEDTNIIPKMWISHAQSSGRKDSSMNVLPNSFICFDLMF